MTTYPYDLKLICQYCDKRFTSNFFKQFCSHKCKGRFFASRNIHRWTPEEVEYVKPMIGVLPTSHIVKALRSQFPYIKTSDANIREKLGQISKDLGECVLDTVDHHSMNEWARLLGVDNRKVKSWTEKGLPYSIDGQFCRISENDIRKFARKDPREFTCVKQEYLEWLLPNDPTLIEVIRSTKPMKPPIRRVKCLDTGRVYPSVRAIEERLGIPKYWVVKSAKSNGVIPVGEDKLRFVYAD